MTPHDISQSLPNGFHGSRIERIAADYVCRTVEFAMTVLVPQLGTNRSRYRAGRFVITGLGYLSLDTPDPHYDYASKSPVETGNLLDTTTKLLPRLPALQHDLGAGFFFNTFFGEEWNGFIHFAGTGAEFDWMEE